jgi:hypothetical protein
MRPKRWRRHSDRHTGPAALGTGSQEGNQPMQDRRGPRTGDDAERGSLTLMLAVLFVALLALAGLVIDGGAKVTQAENAASIAQEAARAGASAINRAQAYQTGQYVVQPSLAVTAADQYLASAGVRSYTVTAVGPASIRVTVTLTQPTSVLSIIGISSISSTGTATASLVTGVTGASG